MIDHKNKMLFIHIPKNAGTSIERTVFKDYNFNTKYSSTFLLGFDNQHNINLQHATLSELLQYHFISNDILDTYNSFAVVRNPYSRSVSGYNWLMKDLKISDTFSNFLLRKGAFAEEKLKQNKALVLDHFYTQTKFVEIDGEIKIKDILKFERLKDDFINYMHKIGLDCQLNLHFKKNKKNKLKTLKLFTKENISLIQDIYKEDFQNFGYNKKFSKLSFILGHV